LTLTLAISFSAGWPGTKNNYLWVADLANQTSGWAQMGTWTVGTQPPTDASVMPASGTGLAQMFSYTVSSTGGASYIGGMYTLLNTAISGVSACELSYNAAAKLLYLIDNGGGWSLPPAVVGTAGTISNSQCTVNTGASSVTAVGNNLTLTLAISFSAGWPGTKNNYLWVADLANQTSGWAQMGTWTVGTQPPTDASVMPASGTGLAQMFSYTVSSLNGASYIGGMYTLLNTAISGVSACELSYNAAAKLLYLIDNGGGWSLPPAVVGTAGTISNSQCTVNTGASSVTAVGNNLTLTLAISFSAGWPGTKNNYLWVADLANQTSGWAQMGTWTVP
jgi:hypothetical protein